MVTASNSFSNNSRDSSSGSFSLQKLVDHFYNLALEGHGDLARGRYFCVLHLLELACSKNVSKYRPSKAPQQWLALLFDVTGDYLNGYLVSGKSKQEIRELIIKQLEQPWQSFIKSLRKVSLYEISILTDKTIKNYLLMESSLKFYLDQESLVQLDIDAMSVLDVFCWLPKLSKIGKGKHTIGGNLLKLVRKLFSEVWYDAIKLLSQKQKPSFVYIFACLPLSGISLLNIIAHYLAEKHKNFPEDYSFAVFYMLATNSTAFKTKQPELMARQWQVINCYVSEQDKINFATLFDSDSRKDSNRPLELISLGLSAAFPQAIRVIDSWLEHCNNFPELLGNQSWHKSVTENLDCIEAEEALVLEAVMLQLKKDLKNVKRSE